MNRVLAIALIAWMAGHADAAVTSPARESSLADVAPAAVIAVERETAAPLVRESLERRPPAAIPVPGFGEFGVPAPEDEEPPVLQLLEPAEE